MVTSAQGGALVNVSDPSAAFQGGGRVGGGGVRGDVSGFSYASRRRMMDALSSVDRRQVKAVFFGTCTAPHLTWESIESVRRRWVQRLERRWAGSRWTLLWRKEPHESGRPHLHWLLLWLDEPPHLVKSFRPWNDLAWAESTGRPDIVRTCCRVEMILKWQGASAYCSKYCAKVVEEGSGRQWGIIRRQHWPIVLKAEACPRPVWALAVRVLRRIAQGRAGHFEIRSRKGTPWRRAGRKWESLVTIGGVGGQGLSGDELRAEGYGVRWVVPTFMRRVMRWDGPDENDTAAWHARIAGSDRWVRPRIEPPRRWFVEDELLQRVIRWASAEWLRRLEVGRELPI